MKITFFKASEIEKNAKATIHRNGRLGFNGNSIKILKLDEFKFVRIGYGDDFKIDGTLYLLPTNDKGYEGFSLSFAAGYYYASTKALFDILNIEYEKKKIIYDISEIEIEGNKMFKLKKREIIRKNDNNEEELTEEELTETEEDIKTLPSRATVNS